MTTRNIAKHSIAYLSFLLFLLGCFSFAYVDPVDPDPTTAQLIGSVTQVVPTSTRSLSADCDSEGNPAAYYVWASLYMKVQSLAQTSNKRIVSTSRILSYDPYSSFTGVSFPTISNIVPHKNSIPWTNKKVIVADINPAVSKVQKPNASYVRWTLAGQLVSNMHYQGISTTSNSNLVNYTYYLLNDPVLHTAPLNSNMLMPTIDQTYVCFDYYVAYCGDGKVDNADGGNGDGHEGILNDNGDIVAWSQVWLNSVTPHETCDEGAANGTPWHCNLTCDGQTVAGLACPTSLTVNPMNATSGTPSNFNFTWNANTSYTSITLVWPSVSTPLANNASSYTLNNYTPASAWTLQFMLTVWDGSNTLNCNFPAVTVTWAIGPVCGNGALDPGEKCDDGNLTNGDACSSSCQLETPTCTLTGTRSDPVYAGTPVVFSATMNTWATYSSFAPGVLGAWGLPITYFNPSFPFSYSYTGAGNYIAHLTVRNNYQGAVPPRTIMPEASCLAPVNVIVPCTLTFVDPTINPGQQAQLDWNVLPSLFNPSQIFVSPSLPGNWPYTALTSTWSLWFYPATTGTYTFLYSGMSLINGPFTCSATLEVGIPQDIYIHKELLTTGTIVAGQDVAFKISFANHTNFPLHNVKIRDVLPLSLDYKSSQLFWVPHYVSWVWLDSGYWTVEYSGFDLAKNQQWYLIVTGTVKQNPDAQEATNFTFLFSDGNDPVSDNVWIDLGAHPVMSLTQSFNGSLFTDQIVQAQIGDVVVYKIEFGNAGASSTSGVDLYNYLPKGIQYVSSWISIPWTSVVTGAVYWPVIITWMIDDTNTQVTRSTFYWAQYLWSNVSDMYVRFDGFALAGGQTWYALITGIVTPAYQYTHYENHARMIFFTPTDIISDQVTAFRQGDVALKKTAASSVYYPGDPITFDISVTNYSTGTISNVSVNDSWPNGTCVVFSGWANATGIFTSSSPLVRNYSGVLAPGASAAFHVYATIANNTGCIASYVNNAHVSYQGSAGQISAMFPFDVVERPAALISLQKTADMASATRWETITYTINYKNIGNTTVNSYVVTDQLPGTLDFVSATPVVSSNTQTNYGRLLQWNFSTPLATGASGQIIVKALVK